MEESERNHLPAIIITLVIVIVLVGLPVAVMTIPALRFLNPHAH